MGWTIPWYSSFGNSFNYDFHVTADGSVAPVIYNYRTPAEHEAAGSSGYLEGEQPLICPGSAAFCVTVTTFTIRIPLMAVAPRQPAVITIFSI
jgi:predicted dithiol-disulfide oxidoreductase (DUF899 family)